jgi:hypothetical protein
MPPSFLLVGRVDCFLALQLRALEDTIMSPNLSKCRSPPPFDKGAYCGALGDECNGALVTKGTQGCVEPSAGEVYGRNII